MTAVVVVGAVTGTVVAATVAGVVEAPIAVVGSDAAVVDADASGFELLQAPSISTNARGPAASVTRERMGVFFLAATARSFETIWRSLAPAMRANAHAGSVGQPPGNEHRWKAARVDEDHIVANTPTPIGGIA